MDYSPRERESGGMAAGSRVGKGELSSTDRQSMAGSGERLLRACSSATYSLQQGSTSINSPQTAPPSRDQVSKWPLGDISYLKHHTWYSGINSSELEVPAALDRGLVCLADATSSRVCSCLCEGLATSSLQLILSGRCRVCGKEFIRAGETAQ